MFHMRWATIAPILATGVLFTRFCLGTSPRASVGSLDKLSWPGKRRSAAGAR